MSLESDVKVIVSPTSYCCPTSSTMISLTDPVRISSTTTSDTPLPRLSTVRVSDVLFSIPSFTTVPVAICDDTVNETFTSLVLDTALIISPSVNVPTMFCSSNSVTAN